MADRLRTARERDVEELAAWPTSPCVSLFIAAHPAGTEPGGDGLRVKEGLRRAEEELVALGSRRSDASDLISGGTPDAIADRTSAVYHAGGFAVYMAPRLARWYRIPAGTPELLTTAERFHLKPLLAGLALAPRFWVASVTRGSAKVYRGSGGRLTPVDIEGLPDGIAAAVAYDDRERTLTSHSASRAGRGAVIAGFHGQGNRADHLDEDVLRYLRRVDAAMAGLDGPVVLAGNPELLRVLQNGVNAARYVPEAVSGASGRTPVAELNRQARRVLAESNDTLQSDLDRFASLAGTGRTSAEPAEVLAAAETGRVDTIFVAQEHQVWASVAADTAHLTVNDRRRPGDVDVLDVAAVSAWISGATVHVVPTSRLPNGMMTGAVFRY